jgi:hypothetical protein
MLLGILGIAAIFVANKVYSKQQDRKEVGSSQPASDARADRDRGLESGESQTGTNSNPFYTGSNTVSAPLQAQVDISTSDKTRLAIGEGATPIQSKVHRDLGVDTAIPTHPTIPIMDAPTSDANRIRTASEGDVLALIDRGPTNGWYDIIDVRSGKEGWVNGDNVQISFTKHPKPAARFAEEYVGSDTAPDVMVLNKTSANLSLKVMGTLYTVKPNSNLRLAIPEGTYSFYATEPGVIPVEGKEEFRRGYRYSWSFWVQTSFAKLP